MKKFLKILLAALFVGLLLSTFVFLWRKTRPQTTTYSLVSPRTDTLRRTVVATGKVEPRDEVLIKPQISGIVSELHKEAGQLVRKGEVIATVKVIPELASLNSAESRVAVARLSLDQARTEQERTAALYAKGVVAAEEFEQGRTALRKAEEELRNAQDNLEITRNGIANRYREQSNTQVRSTIDGMILDVPVKEGNSVIQANTFNDGTTIASVADMSDMLFRGKVDETDVGKLRTGMPVRLTVGAMQDVELAARLEYVAPKAAEENGLVLFEVKAAAAIPDSLFVRAGYSANAEIEILRREGVLVLPESCVEFEGDKAWVHVLTSEEEAPEQTFERREVRTGISDGIDVEIVSGIDESDRIRSNPNR
ncbi:efflux RND transporter periplasmic adaptor subunit [uncultured Alistipes sp.]|uniref:efflux RND transporter periplasmic adaptor subunit n=1 Tax=uncultured Alistipes sp. TaxID=538949 RepID=UPI00262C1DA7|nr:efflux RND transporter periplasmic adaptor subunit [uncultured Alistipes sp.]